MKVLKTIARVLLLLLMVVPAYQSTLAVLGLLVALADAGTSPSILGGRVGTLVGSSLVLILGVWAFRRLGTKAKTTGAGLDVQAHRARA